MGENESRHVLDNYSCILSSPSKMRWCVRQQREEPEALRKPGFVPPWISGGTGAAGGHRKPREEGKMKNPISVPLRGAMGNSLQHALIAELFTHHLGEELHHLHSSITIPKRENLPEASSPLLCLSIALLQQHHSTLQPLSPQFFPSQTRFLIEEVTRTSRKRAG